MTYGTTLAKHLQSFQLPVETEAWVELARDWLRWRRGIQPGRFRDKAEEKEKEREEERKREAERRGRRKKSRSRAQASSSRRLNPRSAVCRERESVASSSQLPALFAASLLCPCRLLLRKSAVTVPGNSPDSAWEGRWAAGWTCPHPLAQKR